MKAAVVMTLAFAVLIPQANESASAQGSPQEETVAVGGTVVDESGSPVADASVSVRHVPQTKATARSAADGSFTLDVPRRSFDGVLLLASDERGERLGTLVHPDQGRGDEQPIRIVVRKPHKLDVTVTDAQGQLVTGARVAAIYRQQLMAEQTTDEGGRAVLLVPAEVQLHVYAVKQDVGFEAARLMPESYEQLTLALQPMHSVSVHVLDDRQRPVAGAKVHPLSVSRAGSPSFSISVYDMDEFLENTDDEGTAVCHIPVGNVVYAPLQIFIEAEGYIRPSIWWQSEEAIRQGVGVRGSVVVVSGNEFTINLKPALTVRGSVVYSDGRPAAGASVGAFGHGYDNARHVQGTKCDAEGAFKIALESGLYYVFSAEAGSGRSRDESRVVVSDRPTPPLKIVLQPARRIYGTITRGPEKTPVALQHLSLLWRDDQSYNKLTPEDRLPNPTNDPAPIVNAIISNGRTDVQGRFEFLVAPGRYYVGTLDKITPASLNNDLSALSLADVTEQSEARIDLHSDEPR